MWWALNNALWDGRDSSCVRPVNAPESRDLMELESMSYWDLGGIMNQVRRLVIVLFQIYQGRDVREHSGRNGCDAVAVNILFGE